MDKGKIGEGKLACTIGKMMQVEDKVDFRRPTFTNAPDDGVDYELRAPHNFPEKLNDIAQSGQSDRALSSAVIDIRIDNKEYADKISKPVVQKFVDDCSKNPKNDEHWLVGGGGLTKGGEKLLEEAKKNFVVRYFSAHNLNAIDNYYENELINLNEID